MICSSINCMIGRLMDYVLSMFNCAFYMLTLVYYELIIIVLITQTFLLYRIWESGQIRNDINTVSYQTTGSSEVKCQTHCCPKITEPGIRVCRAVAKQHKWPSTRRCPGFTGSLCMCHCLYEFILLLT